MLYTIKNDHLLCKISSEGAEIRSLLNKKNGVEHIWQIDKSVWGSSSPVLFPAIGKIKSGQITYQGQAYDMPKHGIIRHNNDLTFIQQSESACSFILQSSEKTLKQYPFHFIFEVTYELIDNRLIMTYHIENKSALEMPFICGGHTAYACPLDQKISLTDYVIEFPQGLDLKASTLGASGLLSDKVRKITSQNHTLQLTENLFNEDALIFENIKTDWVKLRRKKDKRGIVVKFTDFPHLALWAKPGADYVCIEPWLGLPDREDESVNLTRKSTFKHLEPYNRFSIAIETIVE